MYAGDLQLQSSLFFETPEQIFARVFSEWKPRTHVPAVRVKFCKFANANSFVRWDETGLEVRIADVLEGTPAPILEALANILIAKLVRRPVPKMHAERYRRFLNRKEMRRSLQLIKQTRGRKFVSGPQGVCYNLDQIFEDLNARYFGGLMARPLLGWSRHPSRTMLGHYDPSHNAIILSKFLDRVSVPHFVVEYVLFHEMLHLRFPVEHRGARRCVHTREFKAAEKEFASMKQAKEVLRRLCARAGTPD
ncbi:MAG TPA: SprT-like domain-containing protein [Bryobacteraceae bacterium]|nr:SprT-like domain-containing protein [Bryobacteraceae bacterium]